VSSQEVSLWVKAISQAVVQAVRLIIINANYTRYEYDSCVHFKQCNDDFAYLLLYVNDMLIAAKNKIYIQKLKA